MSYRAGWTAAYTHSSRVEQWTAVSRSRPTTAGITSTRHWWWRTTRQPTWVAQSFCTTTTHVYTAAAPVSASLQHRNHRITTTTNTAVYLYQGNHVSNKKVLQRTGQDTALTTYCPLWTCCLTRWIHRGTHGSLMSRWRITQPTSRSFTTLSPPGHPHIGWGDQLQETPYVQQTYGDRYMEECHLPWSPWWSDTSYWWRWWRQSSWGSNLLLCASQDVKYCDKLACMSLCSFTSQKSYGWTLPNFPYTMPVAVSLSFSGGIAMLCFSVLTKTLDLLIMAIDSVKRANIPSNSPRGTIYLILSM